MGNFHEGSKGRASDKVAAYTGRGWRTGQKAEAVVDAAEKEPEKYLHLKEEMDRTGRVNRTAGRFPGKEGLNETRTGCV